MAEVLRLSGVHAGYGPTVVLEDIDLALPERSTLALLGRNGVGKTTLLATVFGLTTLHRGSIEYRGKPIAHMPVYDRARLGMGYVPQARDIFPSLTVEENLIVAERPGKWTLARVYDLFPRIAERRGHMGNQISGGEQQMLAIGRALMGNPELLLMDEPFEGLAPTIVDSLLLAIRRLLTESALTLVLVEQSARLALELTQRAMVLNRGRITYAGSSTELLEDPQRLTGLVLAQ
ncbi:MAG: ABC transporter ATP-binding protein [Betaproteobacteria bacterium RIFCSPLOWO2_02_FULL_65_24]|nr:MAG: ABC transporter ATP-binding protein [Betaproteobacteria bacterium RIFCSPLOWO2_02_FULL_65_24]OGA30862.1 MAG: ABC transporter ATP-binding protein [Betaproteobacteria bacterium RIFCSPLOWO2_12_FULL_62_13b]